MKTSQRSLLPRFVASTKIVQTECNETCFDCRGAANLVQRLCKPSAMKLVSIAEVQPIFYKVTILRKRCQDLNSHFLVLNYIIITKINSTLNIACARLHLYTRYQSMLEAVFFGLSTYLYKVSVLISSLYYRVYSDLSDESTLLPSLSDYFFLRTNQGATP